jgi:cytosine deaminase
VPAGTLKLPAEKEKDLKGRLVCEPYVESHIHLDYIYTADLPDEETGSGTLFEAIDKWSDSKKVLTKQDIKDRAYKGINAELLNGVQYIRTHVDVTDPNLTALKAMLEVKEEVKDYLYLQIIAFPQEGYYAYKGGDELVEEALRLGADVVGGIPHYEFTRELGEKSVKKAFELAVKYDRLLDIHCDETDDNESRFVENIAAEAYYTGLGNRAAASHTCAMGSYNNAYAFKMMSKFKKSGINFISCPTENCYLQGRYDKYPKRRGITRIDELVAAGCNVSFAQDSISDPWYPLGNGNLIHQVDFGLHLGHMMSIDQIQNGLDFITVNGAKTLCVAKEYELKKGNKASFIVLDAPDELSAIRERAHVVLSVHSGKIIVEKKPEEVLTKPF